jgi:hypothetical protein
MMRMVLPVTVARVEPDLKSRTVDAIRTALEVASVIFVPVALAPFIIRWGAQASGDVLWQAFRYSVCAGKGATAMLPSWRGMREGAEPFPVGRM